MPVQLSIKGRHPASMSDLRLLAARRIPRMFFDYLDGGTGAELDLATNRQAVDAVKLVPRFLGANGSRGGSTTIFGENYSIPLGKRPSVWLASSGPEQS